MVGPLHCAVVALLLGAIQGPPVYVYTGSAPSGACVGSRVWIDALGSGIYYCNSGTWAAVATGGGGYATVQDEGVALTARTTLNFAGAGVTCADGSGKTTCTIPGGGGTPGGVSGNLQTNDGAGGFGAYGATSCTLPNVMTGLSASGASTCYTLKLNDLDNPAGDKTLTMASTKLVFDYAAPAGGTGGAFEIQATGGFSGDLLHLHQHTGSPVAGTDLFHAEWTSSNVLGLRLAGPSSTDQAAIITGIVTVDGNVDATSFSGPLTGNASTASGPNGTPALCSAGQAARGVGAGFAGAGCFTPSGWDYNVPHSAAADSTNTTQPTVPIYWNAAGWSTADSVSYDTAYALDFSPTARTATTGQITAGDWRFKTLGSSTTYKISTEGSNTHRGTTAHFSAPAAGELKQYAFQHHGSTAPAIVQFVDGDAQMEQAIFPFTASFDYRWGCATPSGSSSTTITSSGLSTAAATGTAAAVAWASTDERTRHSWIQYPSAATASSSAGVRANADVMWRGNAAGLGGFYWWATMNIVTTTANQRTFMGLKDATAVITATTNPSASLDTVYFGCDAAQTTLRICSNDNAGAATCTDLGANFPCTTANIAYDVALWAAPNASSIGYYIRRLVGGQTASGTLSTDLPRNTVALGWDLWINNGGTAAASTMQFGGTCYIANP